MKAAPARISAILSPPKAAPKIGGKPLLRPTGLHYLLLERQGHPILDWSEGLAISLTTERLFAAAWLLTTAPEEVEATCQDPAAFSRAVADYARQIDSAEIPELANTLGRWIAASLDAFIPYGDPKSKKKTTLAASAGSSASPPPSPQSTASPAPAKASSAQPSSSPLRKSSPPTPPSASAPASSPSGRTTPCAKKSPPSRPAAAKS